MKRWAIREVGTDNFLPVTRTGRGYSYTEPVNDTPARLFSTPRAAINAMTAWKAGIWHHEFRQTMDMWGADEYVGLTTTRQPERDTVELEIVEFDLKEVRNDT